MHLQYNCLVNKKTKLEGSQALRLIFSQLFVNCCPSVKSTLTYCDLYLLITATTAAYPDHNPGTPSLAGAVRKLWCELR